MAFDIFFEHGRLDSLLAQCRILQFHLGTFSGTSSWTHHDPPIVSAVFLEQKNFKSPTSLRVHRSQPSWNYARIIQDQHVARSQPIEDTLELTMLDPSRVSMQHQQAAFVPLIGGNLRDKCGWQFEVEIGGSHGGGATLPTHSRKS